METSINDLKAVLKTSEKVAVRTGAGVSAVSGRGVGVKPSGVITLLTDFGLKDPYVGMMKGVILSINPLARIIDISHQVTPGAMDQAAHILTETYPYFPEGTIHVTVVDPGVGTDRRPITLVASSHLFVGPDNGVLWPIVQAAPESKTVHLTKSEYFLPDISRTFHGRDIFAPAAAHLSRGVDPFHMGPVIHDLVPLKRPEPYEEGACLYGQIVRVDHFGNLMSNISHDIIESYLAGHSPVVCIGDLKIEGIRRTYGDTATGEALALFDSSGYLEVAVNSGRAVDRAGLDSEGGTGAKIKVRRL